MSMEAILQIYFWFYMDFESFLIFGRPHICIQYRPTLRNLDMSMKFLICTEDLQRVYSELSLSGS